MFEDLVVLGVTIIATIIVLGLSLRTVRPTERGIVERLGKYNSYKEAGYHFIIPFIDSFYWINTTENLVDAERQEVITKDNLNAIVDAQIYYKVLPDENSVKKSQYAVNDYEGQITALARTTLRNIIGNMSLTEVNSKRNLINSVLAKELREQTIKWGIEVVRTELKEIKPPSDVQEVMNKVVKAEKEKMAALDFATAKETLADGDKRANIKSAEGKKQAAILDAEGQAIAIERIAKANAEQIKIVNESARKHFRGNAVNLKKLQVAEATMKDNAKYFLPTGKDLSLVVSEASGITPIKQRG